MIKDPPKLRIKEPVQRPTSEQVMAFANVPTSFVVDALGGQGGLSSSVKSVMANPEVHVVGSALTAGNPPADNLATLAALNFVQPGDVIVASAQGYLGCAAVGDSVCAMAKNSGAVGFVTDGAVRDVAGVCDVGLPVFAAAVTPNSPSGSGPGTVGTPILVGGTAVESGDLIVADRDGVVVVPNARIDEVIGRLVEVRRLEDERDALVQKGLRIPKAIAELLASDAVEYIND